MKKLYKKIAKEIFMHAYYDDLCEIAADIRASKNLVIEPSINVLSDLNKSLGKLEALDKLDLLS